MNNKTTKCFECGSQFTVIAYARKSLRWKTIHLCRTCAYRAAGITDEILGREVAKVIPFVKRKLWANGVRLYLI